MIISKLEVSLNDFWNFCNSTTRCWRNRKDSKEITSSLNINFIACKHIGCSLIMLNLTQHNANFSIPQKKRDCRAIVSHKPSEPLAKHRQGGESFHIKIFIAYFLSRIGVSKKKFLFHLWARRSWSRSGNRNQPEPAVFNSCNIFPSRESFELLPINSSI